MSKPLFLPFVPVPLRARAEGWLPARQQRLLEALAGGMSVGAAAAAPGKSRQTAYALRRRTDAESFAAAWDAAPAFAAARPRPAAPAPAAPRPRSEDVRAAFTALLAALARPKSDTRRREAHAHETPNFPNLSRRSVAFRGGSLKRRPC